MDEDGCDSSRIRFFGAVADIALRWNFVQWWIVDLFELYGLWTELSNLLLLSYIEGPYTL